MSTAPVPLARPRRAILRYAVGVTVLALTGALTAALPAGAVPPDGPSGLLPVAGPGAGVPPTGPAGARPPDVASRAGAAAAALFADDFEDGAAEGWSTSGGRWSVGTDGSRVYRQRAGSTDGRARTGEPSWADYTVTARVKPATMRSGRSSIGVLARVQADTGYYYLVLRPDNRLELGRVVAGRPTPLASAVATVTVGGWHPLRLTVQGSSLTGQLGTVSVAAEDSQFARGGIGLATAFAAGSFDDVTVDPIAPPPDTQRPSVPGQPQVLEVVPGAVTITWPASTDNVGVVDYLVYQGDQFYVQYLARIVPSNAPVTLTLAPTAANSHFSVAARDAAGNTSSISSRSYVRQPPSFPRSGDDTEPPSAPGAPTISGPAPTGGYTLNWAPATDNIGVIEYHVYHSFYVDEVRVVAKVAGNSASITPRGGYETVRIVAYDASWNASSSPTVPLGPPPTASSR